MDSYRLGIVFGSRGCHLHVLISSRRDHGLGVQCHSLGRGCVRVPACSGSMSQPDGADGYYRVSAVVRASAGESIGSGGLRDGREHGMNMNVADILDRKLLTLARYLALYIVRFASLVSNDESSSASNSLILAESRYGLGLPLKLRPKANLPTYTKVSTPERGRWNGTDIEQLNYAGRPFYQLGIAGFKASLCLSYLRLLSGTSKSFYRIVIWVVITISTVGHVVGTLVLLLDCSPVGIFTRH